MFTSNWQSQVDCITNIIEYKNYCKPHHLHHFHHQQQQQQQQEEEEEEEEQESNTEVQHSSQHT